jgi:ribonuclease HI
VQNRDLWEPLHELVIARGKGTIEWHYVRGHVGIPGNERVDQIADGLARGEQIDLYDGDLAGYAVPILDIPEDTSLPTRSAGSERKPKVAAHSYLSVVDGKPMRHATWAECERRVKGQSGALFKKTTSPADELVILRGWRIDPRAL